MRRNVRRVSQPFPEAAQVVECDNRLPAQRTSRLLYYVEKAIFTLFFVGGQRSKIHSMNRDEKDVWVEDPKQERPPSGYLLATVGLLALIACCLAINNQSFWVDEAGVGLKAKQANLAGWWSAIKESGDVQKPLYFLFAWGWERLVGLNEFAMRAGNMIWFVPCVITMFWALAGKPLLRWCFLALVLSSPFVWYYLNDARPYAMEIGLSLVVFAALYRLGPSQEGSPQERAWVITLCVACLLLSATIMLAMLWLGAYLGAALLTTPEDHRRRLLREYRVYWVITLTLLLALGLYYIWTLSIGARADQGDTDFRNVMFVAYELLGFAGLGPGRVDIRNGSFGAFIPWLPFLVLHGVVLLFVLTEGWKQTSAFTARGTRTSWAAALAIVAGFILAAGVVYHWRVLGRHCASAVVPLLFVLGAGETALLSRRTWVGQVVAVVFVGLNLISDMNLRFSERHAKEDYRTAAAIATTAAARGERVWWCADKDAGGFYGVPIVLGASAPTTGQVWLVANPTEHLLDEQPSPQLVVFSSRGVQDREFRVRKYLEHHHYRLSQELSSFTVWRTGQSAKSD